MAWDRPYWGTHQLFASIRLAAGQFPPELVQAVRRAGFLATSDEIRAYSQLAGCVEANLLFRQLLADWVDGTLDPTGLGYRVCFRDAYPLPACDFTASGATGAPGGRAYALRAPTAALIFLTLFLLDSLLGVIAGTGVVGLALGRPGGCGCARPATPFSSTASA